MTNHDQIERRLLDFAYTTDATITAPALAYFAPCSIEDATRVLDDLAARDRLQLDVEDDGTVVYRLLGRQRLAAPAAIAPVGRPAHANAVVAGLLGLVMPGAGHIYAGRILAGLGWFVLVSIAYVLIVPGLIAHAISIRSAARAALAEPATRQLLLRDRSGDFAHTS